MVGRTAAKDEALSYAATADEDQDCPYADGIAQASPKIRQPKGRLALRAWSSR
jgi:hypothetical protein